MFSAMAWKLHIITGRAGCQSLENRRTGLVAPDNAIVSAPAKPTATPAVRAKLPPPAIGRTTGTFVTRLNTSEGLVQRIARPLPRFHDQPAYSSAPARLR